MNVYIERNNTQVELIRFRKKYRLYSHLLLRSEVFTNLDSCDQTVYIVTGYNGWWSHRTDIVHTFATDVMFTIGKSFQRISARNVHTVRMESRYNKCLFDKRQFDSNLLLITPFLTV